MRVTLPSRRDNARKQRDDALPKDSDQPAQPYITRDELHKCVQATTNALEKRLTRHITACRDAVYAATMLVGVPRPKPKKHE